MTGPVDRTEILLRAREFIRAHGQVPDTGDLSGNPGEAGWQLLEQVLTIAEAQPAPEPEAPELAPLAAGYPAWWLGRQGGEYVGWLPGTVPLLVVRAATVDGLRQAIEGQIRGGDDAG